MCTNRYMSSFRLTNSAPLVTPFSALSLAIFAYECPLVTVTQPCTTPSWIQKKGMLEIDQTMTGLVIVMSAELNLEDSDGNKEKGEDFAEMVMTFAQFPPTVRMPRIVVDLLRRQSLRKALGRMRQHPRLNICPLRRG